MENSPFSSPCSAGVSYQGRLRAVGGSLMRTNTGILSTRHLPITQGRRSTEHSWGILPDSLRKLDSSMALRRCNVGSPSVLTEELNIPGHKTEETTVSNVCSSVGSGL